MVYGSDLLTGQDWTSDEVVRTVATYFAMLKLELAGEKYSKVEFNRRLAKTLRGRSVAAIEYKHRNISAALDEQGFPAIRGYKSLDHYQGILADEVALQLDSYPDIQALAASDVAASVRRMKLEIDVERVFVPVPREHTKRTMVYERPVRKYTPLLGVDYLKREAENRSLGLAGEEFVLRVEHERLWRLGKRQLAEQIEHVSKVRGDGLGFDVRSFESDGRERFIEVKTTRYGALTPFYASKREVDVSVDLQAQYHLYRLYSFEKSAKVFVLTGSIIETCASEAVSFRLVPR